MESGCGGKDEKKLKRTEMGRGSNRVGSDVGIGSALMPS